MLVDSTVGRKGTRPGKWCQAVFVSVCITFLELTLRAVDFCFGVMLSMLRRVIKFIYFFPNFFWMSFWKVCCFCFCCSRRKSKADERTCTKVCIIGASFGGIATLKGLARKKNVEITIIDSRDYFEYTPGILRAFVQPHYIKNLTAELKILEELGNNVTFLHAEATSINDGEVVVRRCQGDGDRDTCVSFDYLVVATGSRYPSCQVVKPSAHETTLDSRILSLQNMHCEIESAHSVLIIGAGPVGVSGCDV